jgi:trehalose/maltose hydrolase-like predicted phosphorylase
LRLHFARFEPLSKKCVTYKSPLIFAAQFWLATQNVTWLKLEGFPVLEGIARFWASKAVLNSGGSYSIPHIMGPDEYHGDVTDSVYCNVVAQLSLEMAFELAPLAGRPANTTFSKIAANLVLLFDAQHQC